MRPAALPRREGAAPAIYYYRAVLGSIAVIWITLRGDDWHADGSNQGRPEARQEGRTPSACGAILAAYSRSISGSAQSLSGETLILPARHYCQHKINHPHHISLDKLRRLC